AARRRRRLLWCAGAAAATAVVSMAVAVASLNPSVAAEPTAPPQVAADPAGVSDPSPGPSPSTGTGDDPLTPGEVGKARAAALTTSLAESGRDVTGGKGPEYLSSEVVEGGTGRDVQVYYYDYQTDELVKQVVDVNSGKVTGSFRGKGLQRPASDREVATAVDLLLAAPAGADVRALYTKVTGQPWSGKDKLQVGAHIFHARPADTAVRQCGQHRCVQLVARVANGPFVDLNNIIIDLSGRSVARVK
ncbi:MAG TPA: hypothetical protein VI248_11785, partial [Kineosporiaceae bacterium]